MLFFLVLDFIQTTGDCREWPIRTGHDSVKGTRPEVTSHKGHNDHNGGTRLHRRLGGLCASKGAAAGADSESVREQAGAGPPISC